jgi:hypothetical protein
MIDYFEHTTCTHFEQPHMLSPARPPAPISYHPTLAISSPKKAAFYSSINPHWVLSPVFREQFLSFAK